MTQSLYFLIIIYVEKRQTGGQHWSLFIREQKYVNEAKEKGLNCIVNKSDKTYSASESEKKITQLVKDLRYELDMLGNRPILGIHIDGGKLKGKILLRNIRN